MNHNSVSSQIIQGPNCCLLLASRGKWCEGIPILSSRLFIFLDHPDRPLLCISQGQFNMAHASINWAICQGLPNPNSLIYSMSLIAWVDLHWSPLWSLPSCNSHHPAMHPLWLQWPLTCPLLHRWITTWVIAPLLSKPKPTIFWKFKKQKLWDNGMCWTQVHHLSYD